MRILWLTNLPLPKASELMGEKPANTGGWMASLADSLSRIEDVVLSIGFPKDGINTVQEYSDGVVGYYAIPRKIDAGYDESMESHLKDVVALCQPDIIHIHGTEYGHGLAAMNACPAEKFVVSIQGLVSVYAKHYYACLPPEVIQGTTFRDLIKGDNLRHGRESLQKRGEVEKEILARTRHVIGRTEWDKACTRQSNPAARYHHCNESLRAAFYENSWDLAGCEKYSLFVSQAMTPIKGLHFVLEAMPEIVKRFPAARLYVAGGNIAKTDSFSGRLKLSSYGLHIRQLLAQNSLEDRVAFTGPLDEQGMCQRFLKSHVFVSPSSIENSPNSLGEAMLLGVPPVASDVGGVIDMLTHRVEGFIYPYDAAYMLAHYVCEIFADDELARRLSLNARKRAAETHCREKNVARLLEIYRELLS